MKRLVIVAVLMLIMAVPVVGQNENPAIQELSLDNFGAGTRAFSMGNAFVGVANDVTSGTWNPAALLDLEGPAIALSFMRFAPNGKFTDNLSIGETDMNLDLSGIGHFSFVAPIRIKGHPWAFNFNYNRSNNYSTVAESQSEFDNLIHPDTRKTNEGHLQTFNFGLGTRVYNKLSLGFTANIRGSRRIYQEDVKNLNPEIINEVYNISVDIASDVRDIDSTKSSGFNFALGAMYRLDKISFGATVNLPYIMRHNTDRSTFIVVTRNDLPETASSDTIYVVDSIAEQDFPMALTVGLAYTPSEVLTITSDVMFQNYGSTNWYPLEKFKIDAGGQRIETFSEVPIDWNNTFGVGLGVEYVKSTGIGDMPLRAGIRYDQLPQSENYRADFTTVLDSLGEETGEIDITRAATGQQSALSLSLGAGLQWSQIHLDFGWRYSTGAEFALANFHDGDPGRTQNIEFNAQEIRFTFTGIF